MQLTALFAALVPLFPSRLEAHLQEKKPPQSAPAQDAQPELAAERKELAALRLLVVADRKFAEAKERLIKLEQKLQTSTAVDAVTLRRDVRALLDEVRRALGETLASSSERIDEAARQAIAEGDWDFLREIGLAAVPALREAVLATPDFLPSEFGSDPFFHLLSVDPLAASQLCEALGTEVGYFWRRRVLRALLATNGFERESMWSADGSSSAVPGLVQQLEHLLAQSDTRLVALRLVNPLLAHGTLPVGVRQALREAQESTDVNLREAAWGVGGFPLMRDLYLEAARSGDAGVRALAADRLRKFGDSSGEFFALARDPSLAVRNEVATRYGYTRLDWSPAALEALQLLVFDQDPGVRASALRALGSVPTVEITVQGGRGRRLVHREPLPAEFLERMAGASELDVRSVLPDVLGHEPHAVALPLLERLAADADPKVASLAFSRATAFRWEDPRGCLRVAEVALANVASANADTMKNLLATLVDEDSTRLVALQWVLGQPEDLWVRNIRLAGQAWRTLPSTLLRAYFVRFFRADPRFLGDTLGEKETTFAPEQLPVLRDLALDRAQPAGLRLLAARALLGAGGKDKELLAGLPALFGALTWAEMATGDAMRWEAVLPETLAAMPDELVNGCLQALLAVPKLSPGLLQVGLRRLQSAQPGADAVLDALLQAHFGAETRERQELANFALRTMGSAPALARREWIERGARDERHAPAALSAIGKLGDPAYLTLLEELVQRGNVGLAANALQGYLSNEAGELLLQAATRLSGEARDAALAHLAKIREYQAAREEWATRKTSAATRAQVVAELVAKLDAKSEEVRVQAIRALATWEAVEAMPRLIELTQSGSKSVAAAAREALERLNAPKETAGG